MSTFDFEDPNERPGTSPESTEIRESAFLDPELSTMLAILGPAHTPMPEDVWARVQTAMAVESAARETGAAEASDSAPRLASGFQAADDMPAVRSPQEDSFPAVTDEAAVVALSAAHDNETSVSTAEHMRRRSRINVFAAAAVAAAAGGVWLVGGNHINSNDSSTSIAQSKIESSVLQNGDSPAVAEPSPDDSAATVTTKIAAAAVVAVSGRTYHLDSLAAEAQQLSNGDLQPSVQTDQVPAVFAKPAECVQAEVSRLAYEDPHTKVTADMGFIDGEPVGVIVETNTADESAPAKIYIADSSGVCSLQPVAAATN